MGMVLPFVWPRSHGPFLMRFFLLRLCLSLPTILRSYVSMDLWYNGMLYDTYEHVHDTFSLCNIFFGVVILILHAYHYHDLCNCMHFFLKKNFDYNTSVKSKEKTSSVLNYMSSSLFYYVLFCVQALKAVQNSYQFTKWYFESLLYSYVHKFHHFY